MRTDFKINNRILVSHFDSETKIVFYPIRDKGDEFFFKIFMVCTLIFDVIFLADAKLPNFINSLTPILFFFFLVPNVGLLIIIFRFLLELFKGKGFSHTFYALKYFGFTFLKETIILNNTSSYLEVYNVFDKESNFHRKYIIPIDLISKITFKNKEYSLWFIDENGFTRIIKGNFITSEDIFKVKTVIKDKLNENKKCVLFVDKVLDGVTSFDTTLERLN